MEMLIVIAALAMLNVAFDLCAKPDDNMALWMVTVNPPRQQELDELARYTKVLAEAKAKAQSIG